MPNQTFELNLFDTTRTGQIMTLSMLGIFAMVGASVWAGLAIDNNTVKLLLIALIVGGGGYLGWRAYRRAAVVPAVITLTSNELRIEDLRPEPRLTQTLRLADISTYRYSNFNNTEELRLNRADAPPLKLRGAGALAKGTDLSTLLAAFEQAMGAAPNPTGVAVRREKSFFEKTVSTYLLVLFTLVIGALALAIFGSGGRIHGNVFGGIGAYVAYVVAWRAAAARRNAP
ncbi:hypothetical protein [Hymenobacter psoromatis]|uniref:hypothetical protein n=1 Tax=Hymenobacter psoromatis TaxID=1484116 RepID=UPI001CBB78AE|nr:hypothetical protein [Hymenobacter psoromatis]